MAKINFTKLVNLIRFVVEKILIFLVKFYQRFLTIFLGSYNCRFTPSCSNYMIEAIEKKGIFKGIYFGILRILRCSPFSKKSGFDPVE